MDLKQAEKQGPVGAPAARRRWGLSGGAILMEGVGCSMRQRNKGCAGDGRDGGGGAMAAV